MWSGIDAQSRSLRRQTKPLAYNFAHLLSLTKSRYNLSPRCIFAGIAKIDSVTAESAQCTANLGQGSIMRYDEGENFFQIVRSRHFDAELLHERLQVFFR